MIHSRVCVDVRPGRQVHHRVGPPERGPSQLLDLFLDRRRHRRVPDVGVDLDEKVPADRHRLELWMVDVGRDDGAAHAPLRRARTRVQTLRAAATNSISSVTVPRRAWCSWVIARPWPRRCHGSTHRRQRDIGQPWHPETPPDGGAASSTTPPRALDPTDLCSGGNPSRTSHAMGPARVVDPERRLDRPTTRSRASAPARGRRRPAPCGKAGNASAKPLRRVTMRLRMF